MLSNQNIVTRIELQKNNRERVNVFIDKEYSFSCSSELIYTHHIKVNKSVNVEKLQEIAKEESFLKCKNDALRIIEKSYKSEKELFDRLTKKEYDDKVIEKVIEFLKNYNFLNDNEYAKLYVKDKIKIQGKNKIKYSLLRKGISEEIIEDKLKQVDSDTQRNSALKLAEKRYNILLKSESDNRKINKKIRDFLMSNGYEKEIIDEIVPKIVKADALKCSTEITESADTNLAELYELAEKRYKIIVKSEDDNKKQYKKLTSYLLRRGYSWSNIKAAVRNILGSEDFYE